MRRSCALAASAILLAMLAGPALGQSIMDHYRAYNEAVANNDPATADAEGEAAWRGAEQEWGDAQDTAVLAYNLARLRFDQGDAEGALEPARRALELAQGGYLDGVADVVDVELLVATASIGDGRARRRDLDRLSAAIAARDAAPSPPDDLLARAELTLGRALLNRSDEAEAAELAHRAFEIASALGPGYANLIQASGSLEGVARLESDDPVGAEGAFAAALDAFPDGVNSANSSVYANVATGHMLASAINDSAGDPRADAPHACTWSGGHFVRVALVPVRDALDADSGCGAWEPRREPAFPTWAAEQAQQGAVTIVYGMDAEGGVIDPRIAAEVPSARGRWGRAAIDALKDWRRDVPADAPPECRAPQSTSFAFILLC